MSRRRSDWEVSRRRKGKGRERFRRERKKEDLAGVVVVRRGGSGVEGAPDPVGLGGRDRRLLLLFCLNPSLESVGNCDD